MLDDLDALDRASSESQEDEEDADVEAEFMGEMRRMSTMSHARASTVSVAGAHAGQQRPSMQPQPHRVSFAGAGSGKRTTLQLPEETLEDIIEQEEDEPLGESDAEVDEMADPQPFASALENLASSASSAADIRRLAEQEDSKASRYTTLVNHAHIMVTEVKSALYDADHASHASGQNVGAEVLLDEVRKMLTEASQKTLVEAASLQRWAEQWQGDRKKTAARLKGNRMALEELIQRRIEIARQKNEEGRSECDRLWRQIRAWEDEIQQMSSLQAQTPLVQMESPQAEHSIADTAQLGGLTLEGAHSLLRAFAGVLRPHASKIISREASKRSPAEAVTFEFLNACNESVSKASSNSPPPLAMLQRCSSTPAVIHGTQVESAKPTGLLPLPERSLDMASNVLPRVNLVDGGLLPEEQRRLFSQLGESF